MTNQAGINEKQFKWPYKVDYDKVNHIYVDVLVVGGGLAGASAGISAARKGAKVAVADKAPIKRSGCIGCGQCLAACPGGCASGGGYLKK